MELIEIDEERIKSFRTRLLKWHRKNVRDFPWRNTSNPYHILIAELFLQRTQAKQVEPAYRDFLRRFPTIKDLAGTTKDEISESIKVLGLAKKANFVSSIAIEIVKNHSGRIPEDLNVLLALPGIGMY